MQLTVVYAHSTKLGPFYIARSPDGRFHPVFRETSLGSYATAQDAAEDLAQGHTFSAPGIADTAALGIPSDVREWDSARG